MFPLRSAAVWVSCLVAEGFGGLDVVEDRVCEMRVRQDHLLQMLGLMKIKFYEAFELCSTHAQEDDRTTRAKDCRVCAEACVGGGDRIHQENDSKSGTGTSTMQRAAHPA